MSVMTRQRRPSVIGAMVFVSLLALVCGCSGRQKPPDYEASVNDKLRTSALDGATARWNAEQHALYLSGEVSSDAEKGRAEEIAVSVVGAHLKVVNDLRIVEPVDEDARLLEALERLAKDDLHWVRNTRRLSFSVETGVVTISGEAATRGVRNRIIRRVRDMNGVRKVVDQLRVVPVRPSAGRTT
jgi:osmotically-inducible protein OsmY